MKRAWTLGIVPLVVACGPSLEPEPVKTPDQILAEQEQQAIEDEKKGGGPKGSAADETDEEKRDKFDHRQADMEMKRATRSAESCAGVVAAKEKPSGRVTVQVTFEGEGAVKEVSVPEPHAGTPLGKCIENAYKKVKVPPFTGGPEVMHWEVDFDKKPDADKDKDKDDD